MKYKIKSKFFDWIFFEWSNIFLYKKSSCTIIRSYLLYKTFHWLSELKVALVIVIFVKSKLILLWLDIDWSLLEIRWVSVKIRNDNDKQNLISLACMPCELWWHTQKIENLDLTEFVCWGNPHKYSLLCFLFTLYPNYN